MRVTSQDLHLVPTHTETHKRTRALQNKNKTTHLKQQHAFTTP
jgi:hypothetical protein